MLLVPDGRSGMQAGPLAGGRVRAMRHRRRRDQRHSRRGAVENWGMGGHVPAGTRDARSEWSSPRGRIAGAAPHETGKGAGRTPKGARRAPWSGAPHARTKGARRVPRSGAPHAMVEWGRRVPSDGAPHVRDEGAWRTPPLAPSAGGGKGPGWPRREPPPHVRGEEARGVTSLGGRLGWNIRPNVQ